MIGAILEIYEKHQRLLKIFLNKKKSIDIGKIHYYDENDQETEHFLLILSVLGWMLKLLQQHTA